VRQFIAREIYVEYGIWAKQILCRFSFRKYEAWTSPKSLPHLPVAYFLLCISQIIKNWTTWNFGRLFFDKLLGDVQIFSLGKLPQFGELCVN